MYLKLGISLVEYRGTKGPVTITSQAKTYLGDLFVKAGEEMGYIENDCNGEHEIGKLI